MKLSEAFNEYRRVEIQGRGCSLKTDEGVRYAEKVLIDYFGDISMKKITTKQISDFYLDCTTNANRTAGRGGVISQNSARSYIMTFRAMVRFHYKRGVRTINPEEIIIPKREKKHANWLELEQYGRLIAAVSTPKRGYAKINRVRNTLVVKMLFFTGLRVSELCALNRDSIQNREFPVVGKSKEPRPCFITSEIEKDIAEYLAMREDDDPALFVANETGKRITPGNVQRVFRRAAKDAHLTRVTPHTMRHSFATRLLDDHVDIRHVAALLGHQDLNTTKCYLHVKNCELRKIYENVLEKS